MRSVATALACLLLVACDGVEIKPGEKSHARREIPPGPGLLSGEQGEFVLLRTYEKPPEKEQTDEKNEKPKR
jgi:hypothetical protein